MFNENPTTMLNFQFFTRLHHSVWSLREGERCGSLCLHLWDDSRIRKSSVSGPGKFYYK